MQSYNDLNIDYQGGDLEVYKMNLNSLSYSPQHITGNFDCDFNELCSLVGGPLKVDGNYNCYYNKLTDLVGCASHIGKTLRCSNNEITSLVGIHKIIKSCNEIKFNPYDIKYGGIGLLLIDNLRYMPNNSSQFNIIAKYLGEGTKGMMECSKELKAKGYDNYAKL